MATDPTIDFYSYLQEIPTAGFSGIVNFPTVALIDGKFREALEEEGTNFDREVAQLSWRIILKCLLRLSSRTNMKHAKCSRQVLDVICVHLSLTRGGFLGAKKYISIDDAYKSVKKFFNLYKRLSQKFYA